MSPQFSHPWVLLLLWGIPAMLFWWSYLHRKREAQIAAFVTQRPSSADRTTRRRWQSGLVACSLAFMVLAAGGPQWKDKEETVYQHGRDLIIALDVSRSMLADDVHPNRLQRAKTDILDLIAELRGDRAGLLLFRAKAALVCPLTTDHAFLLQALEAADTDSAPRGETDIGAAIATALDAFDTDGASHKAIILISDGEDLSGHAMEMAEKAGDEGIAIFAVGLGSSTGSQIPDPTSRGTYLSHDDVAVITKLNHTNLHAIASASANGAYIPVETASMAGTTLGTIYRDHLRSINARELAETRRRRAVERYQWFLFPGLLSLFAAAYLSSGRLASGKRKPVKRPVAALLVFALVMATAAHAQSTAIATTASLELPDDLIASPSNHSAVSESPPLQPNTPPGRRGAREAQSLYHQEQYEPAAEAYLAAAKDAPRDAARTFRHNAAVAYHMAGENKKAADVLRSLTLQARHGDRDESLPLGIVLYQSIAQIGEGDTNAVSTRARLLHESGEAFKEAWRNNNSDMHARNNLALAMSEIPDADEQARIDRLMRQHEQTPAASLADRMLADQRAIADGIAAAITNPAPSRVVQLEALAARQKALADIWVPLENKLMAAMTQGPASTNVQDQAMIGQLIDMTRSQMVDTSLQLRDLDTNGHWGAKRSVEGIYMLWKGVSPYAALLREDMSRQTNAIDMTTARVLDTSNPRSEIEREQLEAASLTELFKRRFTESVPEIPPEESAQPTNTPSVAPPLSIPAPMGSSGADTNELVQGISPEDRAKILQLSDDVIAIQKHAAELADQDKLDELLARQKKAYDTLLEIESLLPKQNSQQQQQDDQEQDQQQQQNQEPQPDEPQEQQEEQQEQPEEEQQSPEEQDIQQLLQRALDREKEHEEEKRKRNVQIPLPPSERDW